MVVPQQAEEKSGRQVTEGCNTPGHILNRMYGACLNQ
jgi:hypothetical protein